MDRWIELDGVVNMRDLGGLRTADGREVQPRRVIRSDNLQDLTERDIDRLTRELGVSDIVDLRTEVELHLEGPGPLRRVESLTHHHHSLMPRDDRAADQLRGALVATSESAAPRGDARFWAEHYLGYLAQRPDSVLAALEVVATSTGATVVHCAAGKDRTGTVIGVALDVAGVPHETIAADYALSAKRIERIIGRLVDREGYSELLRGRAVDEQRPQAESMTTILTALADGYGGAAGWLRTAGWSADQVERLRSRLLDEG